MTRTLGTTIALGVAGAMIMAAAAGAQVEAQDLAQRIGAVWSGTVRFEYPAAEGVCGNGRGNISVRRGSAVAVGGSGQGAARTREWEDECEPGPVRVALDLSRGEVTALRAYVGGQWRGSTDHDVGAVSATEASAFLLSLAETAGERVAKDAIFPATIALGAAPWARLLRIAKDERRPRDVRSAAIFWIGQGAAAAATEGLREIVEADGDRDVRKSAVFALSQRPKDEAVPALIRIARAHRDPEMRRSAIFWLGQTRDARAVAYFEEVLLRR